MRILAALEVQMSRSYNHLSYDRQLEMSRLPRKKRKKGMLNLVVHYYHFQGYVWTGKGYLRDEDGTPVRQFNDRYSIKYGGMAGGRTSYEKYRRKARNKAERRAAKQNLRNFDPDEILSGWQHDVHPDSWFWED